MPRSWMVELYLHSSTRLPGLVLMLLGTGTTLPLPRCNVIPAKVLAGSVAEKCSAETDDHLIVSAFSTYSFNIRFNIVTYRLVAKRWLCKQRPLLGNARNIHARNNRRAMFCTWSVPRCYNREVRSLVQFCMEVCEERNWVGGRGIAIVGTVTRERLVTDWEH
jgi:hypothetical protein